MIKFTLIIIATLLSGCAGQVISVPVATQGRDKAGNATRGVKSAPIFKNTGNLRMAQFSYNGPYGVISFSADEVDNAIATKALHDGIQGDVRAGGSVVGTALAGMMGIAAVNGATATGLAQSNNARIVTTNASNNATKVGLAQEATKVIGITGGR